MREAALAVRRPAAPPPSLAPLTDEILLGFDFGTRRIGVALGNGITRQARPLAVIDEAGDARWRRIAALVAAWQPARLVVGLPRQPDGAPHALTARCERFARQLEGRYRLPVARVDERYSSAVADGGRDDEAAAVILQQWFDERVTPLVPSPSPVAGEGNVEASPGDDGDEHD
jgi:putative Holliday junction resolvase